MKIIKFNNIYNNEIMIISIYDQTPLFLHKHLFILDNLPPVYQVFNQNKSVDERISWERKKREGVVLVSLVDFMPTE